VVCPWGIEQTRRDPRRLAGFREVSKSHQTPVVLKLLPEIVNFLTRLVGLLTTTLVMWGGASKKKLKLLEYVPPTL